MAGNLHYDVNCQLGKARGVYILKMKAKSKSKKVFKKGDQCVQNPKSRKFRDQVKKNVFTQRSSKKGLTLQALEKHDEEIEDFGDLAISEKTAESTKSTAFSISGLTDCSNITFSAVLDKWHSPNSLDQEKCAILAAVTEVIRSKGGSETESEYFGALMTTLASNDGEDSATAITYLLSLVLKKLPVALLKMKFSQSSKLFMELLSKYYENGRAALLISLLECLTIILSAVEAAVWHESSTQQCFQALLTFAIHSKPRVRKAAHSNIKSLLKIAVANNKNHQSAAIAAKYCEETLKQQDSKISSNHILKLMKQCMGMFSSENLKILCEAVLNTMSSNDLIVKTNSMQTLYALFESHPPEENLTLELNGKIINALNDFQPSVNDVHVSEGWLVMLAAAHSNLSLLNRKSCLNALPKFFSSALSFFSSEHKAVAKAAADAMKLTSQNCLENIQDELTEDIKLENSSFKQIIKIMESGLRYKYQPLWNVVLQCLQYLYATFGSTCRSVMIKGVASLIDLHDNPDFPFKNDLLNTIGAAFKGMGPKAIILERPLELLRNDDVCQFPRAWLLPVMKDNIQNSELKFFISYFLPMAAKLRQKALKCRAINQDLEAKVYETLQSQIWALLPGFCNNPSDLSSEFKNIAMILGTALTEQKELRSVVLQALRMLISKTVDETDLKAIGYYSKNYLPILFNLYTSDDKDCQAVSLSVLETIKMFLHVTDKNLIKTFAKKLIEKLADDSSADKKHHLMDLAVAMVKYSDEEVVNQLFSIAVVNLDNKDKSMQKKGYRILEELCDSNSEAAKDLVKDKFTELKKIFVDSLSSAVPSSKAPRLRCISLLIKKLDSSQKDFLITVIPEVILCTKEVGVKAKTAAFDLLVDIGTSLVFLSSKPKEECIEEYFKIVMAGLAASPHMISATLLAFTKLIFEYRYCLSSKLVGSILDTAISLLKSKSREVIKSSLLFIRAVVKIFDSNELIEHLPTLIPNLFAWNVKSSGAYRQQVRVILERLDKKCGYHLVRNFVPDEHKRFIIQIHKTLMRTKRQKEAKRNQDEEVDDEEEKASKKGATLWQDVLADSDNEENKPAPGIKKPNKKGKENKSWILEGEDEVDLLDSKVAKNIVAFKPKQAKQKFSFPLNNDGKLLIDDEDNKNKDEDTPLNIGATDILSGFDKTPKQIKLGKRKHLEDMPENENSLSTYKPGGAGIHRDITKKKNYGEEYKAKKARGDVKLKGKPDPFAYVPLDRQTMNKRKKSKLIGRFDGLVKAARRGAIKGSKNKRKKN
ncbi:RRP12-like protein isoform X1 [Hydra vulgaris]|uniref:RRP12-like protein isoform X1 n=1 Tax=Hydra vulgaris TaxID=6087 RepID=UPI0032EA56D3